ncbi:MAG: hypothetical protein ABSG68_15355 [Thermoguttaceae bacterium]
MPKKSRILAVVFCGVLLVLLALLGVYLALRHEPAFYRRALTGDAAAEKKASEKMLQGVAHLGSNLAKQGQWQAVFSAEEINGWLAVDLPRNHPDALPQGMHDPRVVIEPDGVTLACRMDRGGLSGVVSVKVDLYLQEPNVVALRVRSARLGAIPGPLKPVLDAISAAGRHAGIPVDWRQADGDPVALVSIPPPRDPHGKRVRIDTLRLSPGQIYLSGATQSR